MHFSICRGAVFFFGQFRIRGPIEAYLPSAFAPEIKVSESNAWTCKISVEIFNLDLKKFFLVMKSVFQVYLFQRIALGPACDTIIPITKF